MAAVGYRRQTDHPLKRMYAIWKLNIQGDSQMKAQIFDFLRNGRMSYINKGNELNNLFTLSSPNYLPINLLQSDIGL